MIKAVTHIEHIKKREAALQNIVLTPKSLAVAGKMTIPTQDGFEVLEIAEILYCQADDNYTRIFLANTEKLVSKTLKHFEDNLSDKGFARVHKSFLVNTTCITRYRKGKGGSVLLANGKELMVAPSRKAALLDYFK